MSFDAHGRPFVQTEREKADPDGFPNVLEPSPMYRLRTNIPGDSMSYRGFPFKQASGPFPCVGRALP